MQKKLLLVEDEVLIAMGTEQDLESKGYNVEFVSNGEKAVEYVLNDPEKFDLVLMDINLGKGIEGTEAAKIILKTIDIPIVFLSSHTDEIIVKKTQNITSYGYVVKNSGITVLDASIKMAFRLYREKSRNLKIREKLVLQKELSQLYLDISDEIFIGLDSDANIILANKKATKIFEYSYNEIIGENWFNIFIPAKIREDTKKIFFQIINGDAGQVEYYTNDIVTKSGKTITIKWHNAKYIKNNEVIGTISSGIDVSANNHK